jgi:stage III sporulation protein AF
MDFLRTWFLGTAGAAVVGVFAIAVTPPGAVKKVVQIASALLLMIAVLRPLAGWSGDPRIDTDSWLSNSGAAAAVTESHNDLLSAIIAEKTAAYIVNKAQALGLVITASAQCRMGEHYPEPWSVTIRSDRPEHAKSALGKIIDQDLGIPPERQSYLQKGGGP